MRILGIVALGWMLTSIPTSARADAERVRGSHVAAGSVVLERGRNLFAGLALVGQGWSMSYRDERIDVSQGIAALGLRGRPVRGLWLQAGPGAAHSTMSGEATFLPAAMVGFGLDLPRGLEVACHAGAGVAGGGALRVHHVSLGVGGRF